MVVQHCAKYSDALLPVARHMLGCIAGLPAGAFGVDQFAGTAKGVEYINRETAWVMQGIELEPEWARPELHVRQGTALSLPFSDQTVDFFFTSPTYGNRMADVDMRDSVAGTYAKSLGRRSSEGSSNHLQWGDKYRQFHIDAWNEADRVLRPHGWFLLNIKDHYRNKQLQYVPEWHRGVFLGMGYTPVDQAFVDTPGNRHGANSELRVDGEWLYLFQKGSN
jgi:hypothetical protein